MIPVTVTYVGDDSGSPFELEFTFVTADGQGFDGALVDMEGQLSSVSELYPNGTGTGTVIIEIPPAGAQGVWGGVQYLFGDSPIFFGTTA